MPGSPRKDIVREGEIGVYHTWSRCVQRAYLCGEDPVTGKNYDYRRHWIQSLLDYLASIFAVDVGNFSILSNHQHLIARTRPDIALSWSDEQVAWRWKMAWPNWIDGQWVREPTDQEIEELLVNPKKLIQIRKNLSSLSWFMARWKEPIAKACNRESETSGHFYEQRFGSRELVDDASLLCCNVYVDLNQVKAGMARSLEGSRHAAIRERLLAWRAQEAKASRDKFHSKSPKGYDLPESAMDALLANCFLAPISDRGPLLLLDASGASPVDPSVAAAETIQVTDRETEPPNSDETEKPPDVVKDRDPGNTSRRTGKSKQRKPSKKIHSRLYARRKRRASNHAILGMPLGQYLGLVQWTARQLASGSHDETSGDESPTKRRPRGSPEWVECLRTWGIQPAKWCQIIEHFGDWFHYAVGREDRLVERSQRAGKKWLHGTRACRGAFT